MGLVLDMALKFYTSLGKWLKPKVRKLLGQIPKFAEVTAGRTDCRGLFAPNLKRVKTTYPQNEFYLF